MTAPTWMAIGLLAAFLFLALFGHRISDHLNEKDQQL